MSRFSRKIAVLACAILAMSQMLHAAETENKPVPEPKTMKVYRTEVAPKLDGKMDDVCWKDAELAKDFIIFKKPDVKATEQTEVRVTYDADALYIFWTLYESQMADVAHILEETRDSIHWADCLELLIDPGDTDESYFQICANAGGHLFDASRRKNCRTGVWYDVAYDMFNFNPDWQVAVGEFSGGWTMEMKVPFRELAVAGEMFATPQPGERWGVSFCRNEGPKKEWSQWTPSNNGFREVGAFARIVFEGFKNGENSPVVIKAEAGDLFYGPSAFTFTLQGVKTAIDGECVLSRNGKTVTSTNAKLDSDGKIKLPYHLLESGNSKLNFSLKTNGKIFYTGGAMAKLPTTQQMLETIGKELDDGLAILKKKGEMHPEFAKLRQRIEAFSIKVADPLKQFTRKTELSVAEWRQIVEKIETCSAEWKQLQYDMQLTRIYPEANKGETIRFAVGAGTENDKFYRDICYRGSLTDMISMNLAGNEYGSFQLVVIPFWTDLENVTASFSPLKSDDGKTISADNYRWFREDYVKLENIDPYNPETPHEFEPDPLLPAAPFKVKAGTQQPLWVDLYVPAGTPEGIYRGTATVTDGNQSIVRDIEVHAYGIDLPKRSALLTDWWLGPGNWSDFYGKKQGKSEKWDPEVHAKQAEVLGRYRIGSFPADWRVLCQQVPIYREPDGRFTFDWSTFDKYVENAKKNNTNCYWIALSCNGGWANYMNSGATQVTERATGKVTNLKAVLPEVDFDWRKDENYKKNPAYRDFLVEYVKHLKELGILNDCYWEMFDEARPDDPGVVAHSKFIHDLVPELRLMNYGMKPIGLKEGSSVLGIVAGWAPGIGYFSSDKELVPAIEKRRAKGETIGAYACGEGTRADGAYTPFRCYNRPLISVRINMWAAWKYQLDEYLLFALNFVPKEDVKEKPEERWPNTPWTDGSWRCGGLVYPGPAFEVVPGMMLASARDGIEDFDLLALLREEAKDPAVTNDKALSDKIKKALTLEPEVFTDIYTWTKDRKLLEAKRDRAASLIREVRALKAGKGKK